MTEMDHNGLESSPKERVFTRDEAADYLSSSGLRMSRTTLARYAMSGRGPKYALIGRKAYYKREWLDSWLTLKLAAYSHALAHMQDAGSVE